ncbi:hypothetical protein ACVBDJ_006044, partial [Escherichia coli]
MAIFTGPDIRSGEPPSMKHTDNKTFLTTLTQLVGPAHILTEPSKTARYRKGFRSGQGDALAVVIPGS